MIEYREIDPSKKLLLLKTAKEIFKKFLKTDSFYELNCSQKQKEKVEKSIEMNDLDLNTFDFLFKEVEKNLKDPLIRFYESDEYHNYRTKDIKRSNSVVKETSKDVIFSPELLSDFFPRKSSSFDNGLNMRRVSWNGMLQKFRDAYQKGLNAYGSPDLSPLTQKDLSDSSPSLKDEMSKTNQQKGENEEEGIEEFSSLYKSKLHF